jgi:hypothetical protein
MGLFGEEMPNETARLQACVAELKAQVEHSENVVKQSLQHNANFFEK